MEATGPYSEDPATALAYAGWRVSVVNPLSVKKFAESELVRNKTDRTDAALLTRYCAKMQPDVWSPPSKQQRQLRALVDRLQALKEMHQQERNRLEGATEMAQSIHEHLHWLEERIKALERDIDDHVDKHPSLKRDAELITTIPGLGSTTAAKLLAYIGEVRRDSAVPRLCRRSLASRRVSVSRKARCAGAVPSAGWATRACGRRCSCRRWSP